MSGGSYSYLYQQIQREYVGRMVDSDLDLLMQDLVNLMHDLEWWQSCDYSEEQYRKTVDKFKKKWLRR